MEAAVERPKLTVSYAPKLVPNMHQLLQSRIRAYIDNSTNARAAEFARVLTQLVALIKCCNSKSGANMSFTAGGKTFTAPFTGSWWLGFCFQLIDAVASALNIVRALPGPAIPVNLTHFVDLYMICRILAPFLPYLPNEPYFRQGLFYDARLRALEGQMLVAIQAAGRTDHWNRICGLIGKFEALIGYTAPIEPVVQIPSEEIPELLYQYWNLLAPFDIVIWVNEADGLVLDVVIDETERNWGHTRLPRQPTKDPNVPGDIAPAGYEDVLEAARSATIELTWRHGEEHFPTPKISGAPRLASQLACPLRASVQCYLHSILLELIISQE
jgi:hypothetical protein